MGLTRSKRRGVNVCAYCGKALPPDWSLVSYETPDGYEGMPSTVAYRVCGAFCPGLADPDSVVSR